MRTEWSRHLSGEEPGYALAVCTGSIWFSINTKRETFWSQIRSLEQKRNSYLKCCPDRSGPAIGKILICVLEHLLASGRVIFLCVALSVE